MSKICVFFDGRCSVCSGEIAFYKRMDNKNIFEWIDINTNKKKLEKYKISTDSSLLFLHVLDKEGKVKIGVDAFITIWEEFKYLKILSKIIGFWPVKKLVNFFYKIWAKKRFKKISYK